MTDYREQMMDADLQEALGGQTPPDLRQAALARLRAEHAFPWRRLLQAAGVALVLGLIGWLVVRPEAEPAWRAAQGTQFASTSQGIELKSGWLLIGPGSPVVDVGGTRIEGVTGRAVASTAYVDGMELRNPAIATQLGLSPEESAFWVNLPRDHVFVTGALTLILLSGQATVDGHTVVAGEPLPEGLKPPMQLDVEIQAEEPPKAPDAAPQPGDLDALKELLKGIRSAELRVMKGDYTWSEWIQIECGDATTLSKSITDNLVGKSTSPAGWKHTNEFLFALPDHRRVEIAVYAYGSLCNVRIPGQAGWTEYDTTPELRQAVQQWLDKAAEAQPLSRDDDNAIRRLLERAESATFRDDVDRVRPISGTLDRGRVRQVLELLWPGNLSASDSEGGTSHTALSFSFLMPGGSTVPMEVSDNGHLALKLPGPGDLVFRKLPANNVAHLHRYLTSHGQAAALAPARELRSWSGPRSSVTEPRCTIITTPEVWKKTWSDHEPASTAPAVDFEREVVVAVFRGSGQNSRGFFIHELLVDDAGTTILRVDERHYQTFTEDRRVGVDRVTPYGIFVLSRTDRALQVEENVQNIIGQPPIWFPRATLSIEATGPEPAGSWRPARNWHGTGGTGEASVKIARSAEEWRELWAKATLHRGEMPALPEAIDWQRQCAVIVTAGVSQGNARHALNLHGRNADRTVLRLALADSGAPRGAEPVVRPIYDIWIIPRPANRLVIETPAPTRPYGVNRWLEEHTFEP